MSVTYELLKKAVKKNDLKKQWAGMTTEELLENRLKQNAKNKIPALKDADFHIEQGRNLW